MQSIKDFYIDYIETHGYLPLDEEWVEYVASIADQKEEKDEQGGK
jgi:hypothetical protein